MAKEEQKAAETPRVESISEKKARLVAEAEEQKATQTAKEHIVMARKLLRFRAGPSFEDIVEVRPGNMVPTQFEAHVVRHMRKNVDYYLEQ